MSRFPVRTEDVLAVLRSRLDGRSQVQDPAIQRLLEADINSTLVVTACRGGGYRHPPFERLRERFVSNLEALGVVVVTDPNEAITLSAGGVPAIYIAGPGVFDAASEENPYWKSVRAQVTTSDPRIFGEDMFRAAEAANNETGAALTRALAITRDQVDAITRSAILR